MKIVKVNQGWWKWSKLIKGGENCQSQSRVLKIVKVNQGCWKLVFYPCNENLMCLLTTQKKLYYLKSFWHFDRALIAQIKQQYFEFWCIECNKISEELNFAFHKFSLKFGISRNVTEYLKIQDCPPQIKYEQVFCSVRLIQMFQFNGKQGVVPTASRFLSNDILNFR